VTRGFFVTGTDTSVGKTVVACALVRELRGAGVVEIVPNAVRGRPVLRVSESLQKDFSLHHTLSLYLLDALAKLDPTSPTHALDVMSLVEAILENPHAILIRQLDKAKGDLVAELKASGVEYDQRMEALEKVDYPKPNAEFIYGTYDEFRVKHPWVAGENVQPKSIARDMVERYAAFNGYVQEYGLGRSEGVLLRYLTQAYKALLQNVPEVHKDESVRDVEGFLRAMLSRVDTTLLREWERMVAVGEGHVEAAAPDAELPPPDPAADPRRFAARVRAELHVLVKALATGELDEAIVGLHAEPDDPWTPERLKAELEPFFAEHGKLEWGHAARLTHLTELRSTGARTWTVRQTLVGPEGDTTWMLEAEIDLREPDPDDGPLLRMRRIAI